MEGRKLQSYFYDDSEATMNYGFIRKSPLTPLCQRGEKDLLPLWKRGMKGDFADLKFLCFRRIATTLPLKGCRREEGFTMVELMITMVIFVIVIAAASQVFTGLLTQFKQQSKISESNTEGIVGLEILRRDLAEAGLGLPWTMDGATYSEAINDTGTLWNDSLLNDGPPNNPARGTDPAGSSNPPGAFRVLTGVGIQNSAVVLSIKAVNVAMNDTCQKSTYIANNGALPNTIKVWNSTGDDLVASDRVIVLNPLDATNNKNVLQNNGGTFYITRGDTTFSFNQSGPTYTTNAFEPTVGLLGKFVVYGIAPYDAAHPTAVPRMPFNRADYYVKIPSTNMPKRCAPNTGVLYKATVNNKAGTCTGCGDFLELPLLDCVADIKVFFLMDNKDQNGNPGSDGQIDWAPTGTVCPNTPPLQSPTSDISCLTADQVRQQVKEVRVYIVAQEGQKDTNYDFSQGGARTSLNGTIIDPVDPTKSTTVVTVDLKNLIGDPEYKYYRWKLYTLVVQPNSLR